MMQNFQIHRLVLLTILVMQCAGVPSPASGQAPEAVPGEDDTSTGGSEDEARRKILESDRWRRARQEFNEWLSVQTLYDDDEVAAMRASLAERVASMSPGELEDFLDDMERRLDVLLSPEADDARLWLSQFMARARDPEKQLGRSRPDVLNMTASQIRQELLWLQQTREQRARAQAGFEQTRALQSQFARNARAARQQSRAPISNRANWPANNPRRPSQYAPQPELRPQPLSPLTLSPWGHPIYWHP
jgi:hypothetical protein